tara:strand:+ start:511 stop:693 length:183 start_codon:yes stop_codon:yes gene_type:complete
MTNNAFNQWLKQCPVPFDYLSEDKSDGQIAYVFHPNVRDEDNPTYHMDKAFKEMLEAEDY